MYVIGKLLESRSSLPFDGILVYLIGVDADLSASAGPSLGLEATFILCILFFALILCCFNILLFLLGYRG